jgi:L-ornithine N5-oxygenase
LPRAAALDGTEPSRIAVIGAGQTAGEIFLHLAQLFPNAQLYSLARNSGIRLYELGHFSNEAYFPEETEYFYALDADRRRRVFAEQRATNYAAVDPDLSTAWYRAVYDDKFFGPGRLHMRKRTAVESMTSNSAGVRLDLREVYLGTPEELDVDVVVLCTGYREPKLPAALTPMAPFIPLEEDGCPEVSKAHRVRTTPGCEVGIYLNGITEWRHGINSATSFSTLALRAERIAEDLQATHDRAPAPRLTTANSSAGRRNR